MWRELEKHDSAWVFREPVDLVEVPDYLTIIKQPMGEVRPMGQQQQQHNGKDTGERQPMGEREERRGEEKGWRKREKKEERGGGLCLRAVRGPPGWPGAAALTSRDLADEGCS